MVDETVSVGGFGAASRTRGVRRFVLASLALGVFLSWIVTFVAALEPFQHGYDTHIGGEWMVTQTRGLAVMERLGSSSPFPPRASLHAGRFAWIPPEVDPRTAIEESVVGRGVARCGACVAGWPWPQTMARWIEFVTTDSAVVAYVVAHRAGRDVDPVSMSTGPTSAIWTIPEEGFGTGRQAQVFRPRYSAARLVLWLPREPDATSNNSKLAIPPWATFARARVRLANGDVAVGGYGWPWPALANVLEEVKAENGTSRYSAFGGEILELTSRSPSDGFSEAGGWPSARVIPRIPLLGGLLLDGIVFAAMLAVACLALAPELVVRTARRRKGRCLNCGQQLVDSQDQCPECGATRKQRARRRRKSTEQCA